MTAALDQEHLATGIVDSASHCVIADLGCRKCGYNLRTLHEDGHCPECGALVGLSTRGDLLQYASPDWLTKLVTGLRLNVWATIASFFVSLVVSLLATFSVPLPFTITGIINISLIGIGVWAIWLITEPAPTESLRPNKKNIRRNLRSIAILGGLIALTECAISAIIEFNNGLPISLLIAVSIASHFINQLGFVLSFILFEFFANRIPKEGLAKSAKRLIIGLAISFLALFVFMTLMKIIALPPLAVLIFGLPSVLGSLIFLIWAVIFMFRLIRAIDIELGLAKTHWLSTQSTRISSS